MLTENQNEVLTSICLLLIRSLKINIEKFKIKGVSGRS